MDAFSLLLFFIIWNAHIRLNLISKADIFLQVVPIASCTYSRPAVQNDTRIVPHKSFAAFISISKFSPRRDEGIPPYRYFSGPVFSGRAGTHCAPALLVKISAFFLTHPPFYNTITIAPTIGANTSPRTMPFILALKWNQTADFSTALTFAIL